MMNDDAKRKFEELKRRAQRRRKEMPSTKTDTDALVENKNASELMPYVYKKIGEAK